MATKKITITIDEAELARIRALVASGAAASVSGFVQRAVKDSLDAKQEWIDLLDAAIDSTGGPPTTEEQTWLDSVFGPLP